MTSLGKPVGPVLLTILRSLMPAVLLLCAFAAAVWWAQVIAILAGRRQPGDAIDFVVFYSAAHLVASGHGFQLYNPAALEPIQRAALPDLPARTLPLPYFNPPFFALFLSPLSRLSFTHAYQVWTSFKLTLLGLNAWMVWRISAPLERRWRILSVVGYATLEPVVFSSHLGQFSQIIVAGWTGGYLFMRSGRDRAAGLALSALLIKPDLLVVAVIVLVWTRRTRVLSSLAMVTVPLFLISVAVVGPHGLLAYPRFLLDTAAHGANGVNTSLMFGWNGLIAELPGPPGHTFTMLAGALLSAGTIAAVLACSRPTRATPQTGPMRWMLITLATVLVSPHFYIQDVAMVMPIGLAVVCAFEGRERLIGGAALGVGWAVLGLGLIPPREWGVNVFSIAMACGLMAIAGQLIASRRMARAEVELYAEGDARAA